MKPAAFDYVRPATVDEACQLLAADPDARLIAGGQTLVPMMAMRLARPTRLVDVGRIEGMRGIREDGDTIVIGAATRQAECERSPLVAAKLPLLAKALPWVGHAPTRNRGTVGGSIANADPAAEIGLVLATLQGSVVWRENGSNRTVAVKDLLVGPMMTSVPAAACLVEVRFPAWTGEGIGVGFHEVSARKSDFAYVSAAAQVQVDASGKCLRCALGIGGAPPVPTALAGAARLAGSSLDPAAIRAAIMPDLDALEIMQDAHATQTYRKRVAAALAERAIVDARDSALAKLRGGRA